MNIVNLRKIKHIGTYELDQYVTSIVRNKKKTIVALLDLKIDNIEIVSSFLYKIKLQVFKYTYIR